MHYRPPSLDPRFGFPMSQNATNCPVCSISTLPGTVLVSLRPPETVSKQATASIPAPNPISHTYLVFRLPSLDVGGITPSKSGTYTCYVGVNADPSQFWLCLCFTRQHCLCATPSVNFVCVYYVCMPAYLSLRVLRGRFNCSHAPCSLFVGVDPCLT